VFSGRVQGVGFRATARLVALRHPVTGWVRNEPDGTVMAEAQGSAEAIRAFLDELRQEMRGLIRGEHAIVVSPDPREREFVIRR